MLFPEDLNNPVITSLDKFIATVSKIMSDPSQKEKITAVG